MDDALGDAPTGRFRLGWDLAAFLLIPLAVAVVGALVTMGPVTDWYPTLAKPPWRPPNWLFAPVWTILYLLMGFAAWRAWRAAEPDERRAPMTLFGVQLALNLGWSVVFFGLRDPFWGLVVIVVLWFAIVATTWAFHQVDRWAGWLFVPYLAWVTFAAALNLAIWRLQM